MNKIIVDILDNKDIIKKFKEFLQLYNFGYILLKYIDNYLKNDYSFTLSKSILRLFLKK